MGSEYAIQVCLTFQIESSLWHKVKSLCLLHRTSYNCYIDCFWKSPCDNYFLFVCILVCVFRRINSCYSMCSGIPEDKQSSCPENARMCHQTGCLLILLDDSRSKLINTTESENIGKRKLLYFSKRLTVFYH